MTQDAIPQPLIDAFASRVSLPAKRTAELLGINYSTLQRHVKAGNIRYRAMGMGVTRPRREFTLADILEFLERQRRQACPSIGARTRRSTTSTSSIGVIGFMARREKRLAEQQKNLSGPKKPG